MIKILRKAIIYVSLFIIGLLAIPVGAFLCVIMVIWKLADKIIQRLE